MLTSRNLLSFFPLKKTLHKVIFYNVFKAGSGSGFAFKLAGSGSALRKTAGSGSAKNECGSTSVLDSDPAKSEVAYK